MSYPRPRGRDEFRIAILCAKWMEAKPIKILLDDDWEEGKHKDKQKYEKADGDDNSYVVGRMGQYNVVLFCAAGQGKVNAAAAASGLQKSFKKIELLLLVGTCGGTPEGAGKRRMFLGDVVISSQVVECDFGKRLPHRFVRRNNMSQARPVIRTFLGLLQMRSDEIENDICENMKYLSKKCGLSYPGRDKDILFDADYRHMHRKTPCESKICGKGEEICDRAFKELCSELGCDLEEHVCRKRSTEADLMTSLYEGDIDLGRPSVHVGWVASEDQLMKSGVHRDEIIDDIARRFDGDEEKIIAFEMEAAGLWEHNSNVMVIKSPSDYSDSHKNDLWQPYSAASAAACVKAVISNWRGSEPSAPPWSSDWLPQPFGFIPYPVAQGAPGTLPDSSANRRLIEGRVSPQDCEPSVSDSSANGIQVEEAWRLIKRDDRRESMKEDLESAVEVLLRVKSSNDLDPSLLRRVLWGLIIAEKKLSCCPKFDNAEKLKYIIVSLRYHKQLDEPNLSQSMSSGQRIHVRLEKHILLGRKARLNLRMDRNDGMADKERKDAIVGIDEAFTQLEKEDPDLYGKNVALARKWQSYIQKEI